MKGVSSTKREINEFSVQSRHVVCLFCLPDSLEDFCGFQFSIAVTHLELICDLDLQSGLVRSQIVYKNSVSVFYGQLASQ